MYQKFNNTKAKLVDSFDFYKTCSKKILEKQRKILPILFLIIIFLLPLFFDSAKINTAYAMDVPYLISPNNDLLTTIENYPPLAIPEFEWKGVTGATQYRLQVSGDIGFTVKIVDITTPNTTFTPTSSSIFSDKVWYWRVRVESPSVSEYSEIRSFTKQWATPENKPVLTSPVGSTSIDFYNFPIFSWQPVMGAAKYKIQISTNSDIWTSPVVNEDTLTTTYQPPSKLANGTYYWRVIPTDSGAHVGTPSDIQEILVSYNFIPQLLEPADLANPVFTPTFRWEAVKGTQFYRLQYSTDPTFNTSTTTVDTRNTTYTPNDTMPNDVNYYWRVRTHSGNSISDWSPVRSFIKKWYIQPVLLTPINNYQHQRFPLFSWTPVPGASRYFIEISKYPGFNPIYDSDTTSNTFYTPKKYDYSESTFYWRVTPYDGNGRKGVTSNTLSYVSYGNSVAPHQVYPFYYYKPNYYPGYSDDIFINPYEDRTISIPIFIWHRVYSSTGEVYPDAYRLQVSQDATFNDVDWTIDTENTAATPNSASPFTPESNIDYYWRVRPLIGGAETGPWSQIWTTQFTTTLRLTPTIGSAPELIRPTDGFEYAEATPLLEWFPMEGADAYEVEISQDENFSIIVDSETVAYPAYAPTQSIAQRSLGDVDFGIYYWRVRKTDGDWSETRRFQIAAQSQWQIARTPGSSTNRLQIGSDEVGDVSELDYDLSGLYGSQSSNYWFFGFNVPSDPVSDVTYALYLDLDHKLNSGADFDARGYLISTIPAFRPEYAIYVLQENGAYSAGKVYVYKWMESTWGVVQTLESVGGSIYAESGFVELQLPNTAIGYQDTTGSYAISLLSLPPGSGTSPQDSVPSDSNVPGSEPISRFSNVTERMNLIMPPNDAGIDPYTFSSILPFYWDYPILSLWNGATVEVHLDEKFTSKVIEYNISSDTYYYSMPFRSVATDLSGDNTYYWRVRPRYTTIPINGVWTQGWRFERQGFVPTNLKYSVSFATPTFAWDMVEGAESYDLQVDNDYNFGSTIFSINTKQNSYTYQGTLPNATYYWRVRARRNGGVINEWKEMPPFDLTLPVPDNLIHHPDNVVSRTPTLCWDPVLESLVSVPVLAAWKYKVQISKDSTFSSLVDGIETEQNCWTSKKGFEDGQYYWRVAMMDGNGILGNYSASATVTKQYPITTLISPLSGSGLSDTPTFIWSAVNGAARYKLEVSLNKNFSPLYDQITTDNTRYTPTKKYTMNQTYYWRVAIIDSDGKIGPFNDAVIILDPYPYHIYLPMTIK